MIVRLFTCFKIQELCSVCATAFILSFFGGSFSAFAQKTGGYDNPLMAYEQGTELFEKEKYGAAQKAFTEAVEGIEDPNSNLRVNAEFYEALCALELFNKDSEFLLKRFIENHSENPKVKTAYFQLGKYKFRKKSYRKAIKWFSKVDLYDLDNQELSEYYFKYGYSCFVVHDNEQAKIFLYEIKDAETKYSMPATYYYSHIAYNDKNYETALHGFKKISSTGSFQNVVPYYIAQIYYLQERHEELLEYALPLLDSASTKRGPEIARLIGEGYFATSQYEKSIPYLKMYMEQGHHALRKDLYQLAFACYKSGSYEEAVDVFKQVVNKKDELAQNAYYHLADCYLKMDKKKFARYAFHSTSKYDFNKKLKETAAYNYAKLSCELGLNSIYALNRYIFSYPESPHIDEAYQLLVNTYLTTKNYSKALKALDKIAEKSDQLKEAYQRIAFYRGVELFNDKKIFIALGLFDKALTYPIDKKIEALSYYWKGEGHYRLKQYKDGLFNYNKFIYSPGAFGLDLFSEVYYNSGYAHFKMKDYPESISWFRKYVRDIKPAFEKRRYRDETRKEIFSMAADAYLRLGDGYFITKDYEMSIEYYDKAVSLLPDSLTKEGYTLSDVDYAQFQKGLAKGVLGDTKAKLGILQALLANHEGSSYTDDAKFEMAKSYSILENPDSAVHWYKDIASQHPNSSYVKKSLLNMGLEHYNRSQNEEALATFKEVIATYPATAEAKEALVGVKNIYVDLGDIDTYSNYVAGLSFANITEASLDSTTYEAAELVYMRGDRETAAGDFSSYLNKFPSGFFALNAEFYKAECLASKSGDSLALYNALKGYEYVLGQPKSSFTEKALLNTATIKYQLRNFSEAVDAYARLEEIAEYKSNVVEARVGQMRCYFYLKDYIEAIPMGQRVLETPKVSNETLNEAHYMIAKSSLETDNYNLALKEFKITHNGTRSEISAASKYYVAYIQYLRSEHDSSEQAIFELAKMVPSYDYWVAKGFILLADNYLQMGNAFQAKATLQSIIDNNEKEELLFVAKEKLEKIKVQEALEKKREIEYEEIEIEFDNYDIKYDDLFDEEEDEEEEELPINNK